MATRLTATRTTLRDVIAMAFRKRLCRDAHRRSIRAPRLRLRRCAAPKGSNSRLGTARRPRMTGPFAWTTSDAFPLCRHRLPVVRFNRSRRRKYAKSANAGFGDPDLLPFWFRRGPMKSRRRSFATRQPPRSPRGETFYTHNLGIPELRETIAAYVTRLHRPTAPENDSRFTASGMSALMLSVEALVAAGAIASSS